MRLLLIVVEPGPAIHRINEGASPGTALGLLRLAERVPVSVELEAGLWHACSLIVGAELGDPLRNRRVIVRVPGLLIFLVPLLLQSLLVLVKLDLEARIRIDLRPGLPTE